MIELWSGKTMRQGKSSFIDSFQAEKVITWYVTRHLKEIKVIYKYCLKNSGVIKSHVLTIIETSSPRKIPLSHMFGKHT